MSQTIEENVAPKLRQTVKFGERYVSSALNRKFEGILAPGIYRGFELKAGGVGKVLVTSGDYDRSVAVVERDGYNITVTMDDAGYVAIPAAGEWFIVIEAMYIETQQGYERIVARERAEAHHIVIGKVVVEDISKPITDAMCSNTDRMIAETKELSAGLAVARLNDIEQAKQIIRLADRITKHELAVACTGQVTVVEVGNCDCDHVEGGTPLVIDPTESFEHALYGETESGTVPDKDAV